MGPIRWFSWVKVVTRAMPRCDSHGIFGCSKPLSSEWEIEANVWSIEMKFWWKILKGWNIGLSHIGLMGRNLWVGRKGQPKFVEGRCYGLIGLDPLDPKITTRAVASVRLVGRAGFGRGCVVWGWVGLVRPNTNLFGPKTFGINFIFEIKSVQLSRIQISSRNNLFRFFPTSKQVPTGFICSKFEPNRFVSVYLNWIGIIHV